MIITNTEISGNNAIYWFGDEHNEQQFGVCFQGPYFNIARQSLAESLALANDVLTDAVDDERTEE